ncbi:MAG TPA: 1-deoxy-D-xylulose-5-phosphate synthase [Dictyoglomaceae bacterium]|nr:1-deoxy-D-xylulose-5-phosphate synthase [Dictyoglomaceae bacterium]HOL38774.1 1-deoxy-D-xylulose-5-phosphate synthase [Dictyoglomaceae bacterium]HPP15477.1 1-deoxy-D-xylulose-5-phosphate synthase [Dictyoglomaceae bacterium]HPU43114.1 1-deoxy-D-xylulose-5-phosphate synthase [Dictyoglomaceae bacterium]
MLVEKINSPQDLKNLSISDLEKVSEEIRNIIINTVDQNGGHLASNLGTVELTLALHYIFETPQDKIIWDVGHQCYTHKLITGRGNLFHTLRQYGGISGYIAPWESSYDHFAVGHAGTSLSAALGFAKARDLRGEKYKVIAVIGDGALTSGMAWEALNQIGYLGTDMIVILNDNEHSISPSVGALALYLTKLRKHPLYRFFKQTTQNFLKNFPFGEKLLSLDLKLERGIKSLLLENPIFENLGFKYFGPFDGHDIPLLTSVFKGIKETLSCPVLIHVTTKKGNGYKEAEASPSKFHSIVSKEDREKKILTYTEVFGKTLVELGKKYDNVVAITAAMPEGTGLSYFAKEFPDRFFDVSIAEEHAVTFAAGLARDGFKPVVAIYSTFLQRAFDQIIHDVCLQKLPVVFILDRSGIVSDDGPTHQGIFDLSYLRLIPNLVIMAPKDELELRNMLYTALEYPGPIAIRFPKGKGYGVNIDEPFKKLDIGKGEVIKNGEDVILLAIGSMVYPALKASDILEEKGINPTVVNLRFLKPLDVILLEELFNTHHLVFTLEENIVTGGLFSAISELACKMNLDINLVPISIPEKFLEQGNADLLRDIYGLTPERIAQKVLESVKGVKVKG